MLSLALVLVVVSFLVVKNLLEFIVVISSCASVLFKFFQWIDVQRGEFKRFQSAVKTEIANEMSLFCRSLESKKEAFEEKIKTIDEKLDDELKEIRKDIFRVESTLLTHVAATEADQESQSKILEYLVNKNDMGGATLKAIEDLVKLISEQ